MRKMDIQIVQNENQIHNSKFKTFNSSFIADVIGFMAVLLTIIVTLIIIHIVTRQSKLKTLVANIALQCVKAVESAALKQHNQNCEFRLVKFLMILNLILVTLMALAKFKKSRIFKGQLFSNIVKFKLFIADAQCYIPLNLKKKPGSVHFFKLHGTFNIDNITLKKNWIWYVLEIDWTDVHVSLNDKEINLPMSVVIPLSYKIKISQLLRNGGKDSLHLYVMLMQRKSWFNLENTECN